MSPFIVDTDALHAYADGRLGPDEAAAVEAWLASNPDAAAEVASWQRQNDALSALFPAAANEPVPDHLRPARIAANLRAERAHSFRNIAAALALVVLGSGVGWYGRDYLTATQASDHLIEAAVSAHTLYIREKSRAVEVPAGGDNLMSWLGNRIETAIDAPDLTAEGYRFLGGRLLPVEPGYGVPAAAQLMYENAAAERVTLYITAALPDRAEAWEFQTTNGVSAYYWANQDVTCTVVASLPESDLRGIGKKVFEQLTRRPETALHDW